MPALAPPANPRLAVSATRCTSGKLARTSSAVPSVEPLSTTMTRAGWVCAASEARHAPRKWAPFQLGITTAARATATAGYSRYDGSLQVNLDAPLPAELAVGAGTVLFVHGTCFDAERTISSAAIVLGEEKQPVAAVGMPRLDHFRSLHPRLDPLATNRPSVDPDAPEDPQLRSYRSGFWGLVRVGPAAPGSEVTLRLRASFEDRSTETVTLGHVRVAAPPDPLELPFPGPAALPRVAICMATHEPPLDLLARQLDSIRAQSHTNWVCVISDDCSSPKRFDEIGQLITADPRFTLVRSKRRLGFYGNFERALALAPRDCEYVALADQDDRWYPDKIESLLEALGDAQLAYSDARVINRD